MAAAAAAAGAAWRRFLRVYSEHGSRVPVPVSAAGIRGSPSVAPPATAASIAALEVAFGQPIHPELRAVLEISDGAYVTLGSSYQHLLSCEGMVALLDVLREFSEDGVMTDDDNDDDDDDDDDARTGVKISSWRHGWLPIAGDSAYSDLVMDYDPDLTTGGVVGQLINHDRQAIDCGRVAVSLTEYINACSAEIESRELVWDAAGGAYVPPAELARRIMYRNRSPTVELNRQPEPAQQVAAERAQPQASSTATTKSTEKRAAEAARHTAESEAATKPASKRLRTTTSASAPVPSRPHTRSKQQALRGAEPQ